MQHHVDIQPSGRNFASKVGETILDAAIRHGVGLPYGCKDGACGSCKCRKLEGEVIHKNYQAKALSEVDLAAGFILTCCAVPQSDVRLESRQVTDERSFPVKKMPVRVQLLEKKSPDVMLLRLQLPANDAFRYHAGQYIEFILRDGTRRAYSMANPPHTQAQAPALELHIRHMPGGQFTDHVFSQMKEKEILRIEGPFGSFYLRDDSTKPMIFLASGTGFAPIQSLILHLQHHAIQRPVTVYWGGRRPQDLYMHQWLEECATAMPNLRYVAVVSDALPEDKWQGRCGFVHQAVMDDFADLSNHQVYACGAPVMVATAQQQFVAERQLLAEEFYADAFTSAADKAAA